MFKKNAIQRIATRRLQFEELEPRRLLAITWVGEMSTDFSNMGSWDGGQPASDVDVIFRFEATQSNNKSPILSGAETVANFSATDNTTDLRLGEFTLTTEQLDVFGAAAPTLNVIGVNANSKWKTNGKDVVVGSGGDSGTFNITTATLDLRHETDPTGKFTANDSNVRFEGATIHTGEAKIGSTVPRSVSNTVLDESTTWNVYGDFSVGAASTLGVRGVSTLIVHGHTTFERSESFETAGVEVRPNSVFEMKGGGTNRGALYVHGGRIDTGENELVNDFSLRAGILLSSPASFNVDGDLKQTDDGMTFVRIRGTQNVDEFHNHDVFLIEDTDIDGHGGKLTLDGRFTVELLDVAGGLLYDPPEGAVFSIMRATEEIDGTFDADKLDLPDLGGSKTWEIIYEETKDSEEGHDDNAFEVLLKVIEPDLEAKAFEGDGYGGLVVDYEIHSDDPNFESDPFSIGIYKSDDGVNPTGGALQTVNVTSSGDLTVGSHSATISPSFYAQWGEHRLIAVVDSGDVIDESDETNNVAEFENGAFLGYGGTLAIYGDDAANTIEVIDSGSNYVVDIDSETIAIIAKSQVSAVHVHSQDGNDTVDATAVDKVLAAWAGKGHDTVDAGSYDNYVYGGEGDDTLTGGGEYDYL